MKLRAATRGSPLAIWQTNHIAALLERQGHQVEPVIVETDGEAGEDSEEGTSAGESEESSDDQEDTT